MDDHHCALAFEQLHEFIVPTESAVPVQDLEVWTRGVRFALDAIARSALDPLKSTLEACAAEKARCVALHEIEPPVEHEALEDAVWAAICSIEHQLDLIAARATGNRLDKAPIVRSLTHLRIRLERAVSPASTSEARHGN